MKDGIPLANAGLFLGCCLSVIQNLLGTRNLLLWSTLWTNAIKETRSVSKEGVTPSPRSVGRKE